MEKDGLPCLPSQNCKLTKISQNQLIILNSILSNIWKIHVLIESWILTSIFNEYREMEKNMNYMF